MKGFRVTKNVKEINFEGIWGELEAKKIFPEIIILKVFKTKFDFHVK